MTPHIPFGVTARGRHVSAEEVSELGSVSGVRCPHCGEALVWVVGKPPFFRHRPNYAIACDELRFG